MALTRPAHRILTLLLTLSIGLTATAAFAEDAPTTNGAVANVRAAAANIESRTTEMVNTVREDGLPASTIIAWIVLGALVGGVVGSLFKLNPRGFGLVLNLLIGGIAALAGGLAVRLLGLDFGWPRVSFTSEAMVVAILFAIAVVLVFRWIGHRAKPHA